MNKLTRIIATSAATLTLAGGLAGAAGASSGSITKSGPDSHNEIKDTNSLNMDVNNDNDVNVRNTNPQTSSTGDAKVKHNTTGGDATSGDAANNSSTTATLTVNNSGGDGGMGGWNWGGSGNTATLDQTGPESTNKVTFKNEVDINVRNDNDLKVTNNNSQHASSGDASVSGNTTGGNATSGSASNNNSTSTNVSYVN